MIKEKPVALNIGKWFPYLMIFVLVFFLSGCWDRRELNDLAIITGIGIDRVEGGKIELIIQEINPRSLGGGTEMTGGGGGGGGQGKTLIRSETGVTLSDALSKLQRIVGRKIFWGQTELIIFGEGLVRENLQPSIDFLLRHPQVRLRAKALVSKKPREILSIQSPVEVSSARTILQMIDLQRKKAIDLNQLQQMMAGDMETAIIPNITTLDKTTPYIEGSTLLKDGKMIGKLNQSLTQGVLWLRNELKMVSVSLAMEKSKGDVALEVIDSQAELTPWIEGGKWRMNIKIEVEDDLSLNETSLVMNNPRITQLVEKAAEKEVHRLIHETLRKLQHGLKADVIGFGEAFHRKYPREWEQVKGRWDQVFPQVEVAVQVKVNVRRIGMTHQPAGIPLDRVRKK